MVEAKSGLGKRRSTTPGTWISRIGNGCVIQFLGRRQGTHLWVIFLAVSHRRKCGYFDLTSYRFLWAIWYPRSLFTDCFSWTDLALSIKPPSNLLCDGNAVTYIAIIRTEEEIRYATSVVSLMLLFFIRVYYKKLQIVLASNGNKRAPSHTHTF